MFRSITEASLMTVSAASTKAANMTTTSSMETNETTTAVPVTLTTVSSEIIEAECESRFHIML